MPILYAVLILFIVVFAWRINHPGDLRVNRRYIARYVHDLKGNGPKRVRLNKLPFFIAANQPEEKVFYDVTAEFADGSKRQITAQVFYPLESLQQERERKNRPGSEDSDPMQSFSMQRGDSLESLKEDPFKDLTKEERLAEAKKAMLAAEIEQLKILNQVNIIFPRLIAHDERKLITLTESVGTKRLDNALHELPAEQGLALLDKLVRDLAHWHERGQGISDHFPPGAGHTEAQIKDGLIRSFESWSLLGVTVQPTETLEILEAARPLFETSQSEIGLRLVDSSPRSFFVQGNQLKRVAWGGVRQDTSAFDVIELICDPAIELPAEQELALFATYVDASQRKREEGGDMLNEMISLAIYFRLVLIGYLCQYVTGLRQNPKQAGTFPYWTEQSLSHAVQNLLAHMQESSELEELSKVLRPKLRQLTAAAK